MGWRPFAGFYAPVGWDTNWQNALASASTSPCSAIVLGASLEMGGSASTDIMTKSWWALWCKGIINRGFTRYGDFLSPMHSAAYSSLTVSAWPFVMDLAPTQWSVGPNSGPFFPAQYTPLNNGSNPLMHYVHPTAALGYRGRSFDIVYFDPTGASGASWTFNVNGGTAQTIPNMTGGNRLLR